MRLAIVGGSAASTPWLFDTPEIRKLGDSLDVCLLGRSEQRLSAVQRAIRVLTGRNVSIATDYSGLNGADLVLLQARYGGYAARADDEAFPLAYGMCGDEGLGAGGLAAAFRSWPELERTLGHITARCPKAKILLLTAPLGILMRCASEAFPELDVAGICELPWATLVSLCAAANVPASGSTFNYAGVNHLGWFDRVSCGAIDVLAHAARRTQTANDFPAPALVQSEGAYPLKYLRAHYFPENELARQRAGPPRAETLERIQRDALDRFLNGDAAGIRAALNARPAPWYSGAVAPFVAAVAGETTDTVFFLSVKNAGYLPEAGAADILERPFSAAKGTLRARERTHALSRRLSSTLLAYVGYERAAAHAVQHGRVDDCSAILALHPWARTCSDLDGLASAVARAVYETAL